MESLGVEVKKTINCFLDRARLAEVTRKSLAVFRLTLTDIWHVGRDIHQSGNGRVRARFRNDGSPIAVSDKNAFSRLLSEDAPYSGDIFGERCQRLLNDADVAPIPDQNFINAFPAGAVGPGPMNQHHIPYVVFVGPGGKRRLCSASPASQQNE